MTDINIEQFMEELRTFNSTSGVSNIPLPSGTRRIEDDLYGIFKSRDYCIPYSGSSGLRGSAKSTEVYWGDGSTSKPKPSSDYFDFSYIAIF